MQPKHFIQLRDFSRPALEEMLQLAADLKSGKIRERPLQDKTVGLLFSVASTRSRISFQVATRQLGGHAEFLSASDLQLQNRESLKDTASVIGRYLDAIIVRMYDMQHYGQGRQALETIAQYAGVPVINALDDLDHPSQVMGDLVTLQERYGAAYRQKKVVFTWGYSKRSKSLGVPHSLMSAGALLGMNLTFAYPKGFDLDPQYVRFAQEHLAASGGKLQFCNDLMEAAEGADVIYMKNWKGLTYTPEEEIRLKEEIRERWCVSDAHFRAANPGAYYMDCLPTIRGEGVSAEVVDGPQSIVYDQAENGLHAKKAILFSLLR